MEPSLSPKAEIPSMGDLFNQLKELDLMEQTLSRKLRRELSPTWQLHVESEVEHSDSRPTRFSERAEEMEATQAILRDLRDSVRETINIRSRPKIRSLNILDMPDEILMKIFDHTKDETPLYELYFFFDDHLSDIKSIKNIRLTCSQFYRTSSHLLLRYVDVSMTESSAARLLEIAHHPSVAKGIRSVRLNVQFYSSGLADDIQHFATMAITKLRSMTSASEPLLRSKTWWEGEYPSPFTKEALAEAVEKGSRMADVWEEYRNTLQIPADEPSSQDITLLLKAHDLYRQRYDAQQRVFTNGALFQSIAVAMAKMPKANRIWIEDTASNKYWEQRKHYVDLTLNEPDALVNQELLQPLRWEEASLYQVERPPIQLLVELPVAIDRAGVSLIQLDINLSALCGFTSAFGETQLRSLTGATDRLKVFKLKTEDVPDENSDEVGGLHAFLSAILRGKSIARLDLTLPSLNYPHNQILQGSVLTSRSWSSLRLVRLNYFCLHLADLQAFLNKLSNSITIELENIHLLSGTWADSLDALRNKAGWRSRLSHPSGAECEDMPTEDIEAIFNPTYEPHYRASKATRYITGWAIPNPLKDEDGETADDSHQAQ